jgi:hypothetical protein
MDLEAERKRAADPDGLWPEVIAAGADALARYAPRLGAAEREGAARAVFAAMCKAGEFVVRTEGEDWLHDLGMRDERP